MNSGKSFWVAQDTRQPGAGNIATLPDPVIELCTLAVRLKITVVRRPEARDLMQLPG